MALIRTIETDPTSPFGEREVPPAEWTYRACRQEWNIRGELFIASILEQAARYTDKPYRAVPPFPTGRSLERDVYAHVDHARWLWDCPICGSAQVCSDVDDRAFCVGCFNARDGWWPVIWPDERATIETLLSRRPRDDQRSWALGETIEQLQAENLSIGVDPDVKGHEWPGGQKALELARKARGLKAGAYVPALTEAADREAT